VTKTIAVQLVANGQPLQHLDVRTVFQALGGSGGHCHDETNRPGFYTPSGTTYARLDSVDSRTDNNGMISIQVVTPEAATAISMTVFSRDPGTPYNPSREVGWWYFIRVPNLTDATTSGIPRDPDADPRHYINYYADQRIMPQLHAIFDKAAAARVPNVDATDTPDDPYAGATTKLAGFFIIGGIQLDDVSLPWGGVFDVGLADHWTAPFCFHRYGLSADIKPTKWPLSATLLQFWLGEMLPSAGSSPPTPLPAFPRFWTHVTNKDNTPRIHFEWGAVN